MKKIWCYVVMMIGLLFSFSAGSKVFAASAPVVTGLTVETGREATSKLEEQGYEVIYTNFNAGDVEKKVYIGYKRGSGTAITDLRISEKKQDSITVDGISYQKVSGTNLNTGSSGDAIYLYATTDSKAGGKILDLSSNVYNANGDSQLKGYALTNDGAVPVRKDNGSAANLEQGKSQKYAYLMMVRDGIYQPYIREVHMACESSKRSAISKLASLGCDYYLDAEFPASGDKKMMIGYSRTSQESEAVTAFVELKAKAASAYVEEGLTINGVSYQPVDQEQWNTYGYGIFATRDPEAGMPVQDLLEGDMDGYVKPMYEWVRGLTLSSNYSLASSYMTNESDYQYALEDENDLRATGMLFVSGDTLECGSFSYFSVDEAVSSSPWDVDPAEFESMPEDETSSSDMVFEEEEEEPEDMAEASSEVEEGQLFTGDSSIEVDVDSLEADQKDLPDEDAAEDVVIEDNTGSVFAGNGQGLYLTLGVGLLLALGVFVIYRRKQSDDDNKK